MYKTSNNLNSYIKKVEEQSNRKILIEYSEAFEVPGMKAAFQNHPTHINIILDKNQNFTDSEFEQTLAHEATHGLLCYGKNYFTPVPIPELSSKDLNLFGLVATMIDDIVVNYLIYQEGFKPYTDVYLGMVRKEISYYTSNQDIYKSFNDPIFKSKFKIFRYVLAWGFITYYNIPPQDKVLLSNFHKKFKKTFSTEFKEAEIICKQIAKNNIFNRSGHEIVVRYVLKLWGLADKILN